MRLETAEQSGARQRRAKAPAGETQRRCALTRASRNKADLIRFVLSPEGEVVPDLKERLPGRGVWLTASHEAIAEAAKRKAFARAFKTDAKAPASLAEEVDGLLKGAALGALAMTNKAGEIVFGTAKIEEALRGGKVIALIHALDAAPDGCRKLDGKARAATEGRGLLAISAFNADELGLASGRTNVIHAALIQGGAAQKFLAAASRVARYREDISAFADRHGSDTD